MTEKRYRKVLGFIERNDGEILDLSETEFELNKLYNENEQIKQEYNKLRHRHSLLYDEYIEVECDKNGYHKDVLSLEKENEKLKKRLID